MLTSADDAINRAFTKQSVHYDEVDRQNPILQDLRQQVYDHLERFLKPNSKILELNSGTGIDALQLAKNGHTVHATDISDGMVEQIRNKIQNYNAGNLTVQQLSSTSLHNIDGRFDFVFSNFGGLNCLADLTPMTRQLPKLLVPGGIVTLVIMPPVCLWELATLLKGKTSTAFRRMSRKGTRAHIEGEFFQTYYHSLSAIRRALGPHFRLLKVEGLAAVSPPPHRADFPLHYPRTYKLLRQVDGRLKNIPPFNRWADHIIATFEFTNE